MEATNRGIAYRTHRVGSITAGISMMVFGGMLLSHSLFDIMDYQVILSLWPVVLIGLGIELLLSNIWEKKIVYDKGAIVLMFVMTFFAIGMAVTEMCMKAAEMYIRAGM
ncbi:MAG: hypothetical protein IJE49_00895 [Agathobacter sp.]|nr:hypothetical protein [Agathobacter sp.]